MKTLLLPSLLVLFAASAFAQDSTRGRPRIVPSPPSVGGGTGVTKGLAPIRARGNPVERPVSDALTKNVTLKWKGSFHSRSNRPAYLFSP